MSDIQSAEQIIASVGREAAKLELARSSGLAPELSHRLFQHHPFSAIRDQLLLLANGGRGQHSAPMGYLGGWVLRQISAGRTPRQIIALAVKQCSDREIGTWIVTEIRGLRVDGIVQVTKRGFLFPRVRLPSRLVPKLAHDTRWMPPHQHEAAFVQKDRFNPFEGDAEERWAQLEEERRLFVDALTLSSPHPYWVGAQYSVPPVDHILHLGVGIRMNSEQQFHCPFEPADPISCRRSVKILGKFEQPLRLHDALNRLASAKRSPDPITKVVDLGIALEMSMTHGGNSSNSELAYKVSLRAAKLVGGTLSSQIESFKTAQAVYASRSSAVHEGVIKHNKKSKIFDPAVFEVHSEFVRTVLYALAKRGQYPNWLELELGG